MKKGPPCGVPPGALTEKQRLARSNRDRTAPDEGAAMPAIASAAQIQTSVERLIRE